MFQSRGSLHQYHWHGFASIPDTPDPNSVFSQLHALAYYKRRRRRRREFDDEVIGGRWCRDGDGAEVDSTLQPRSRLLGTAASISFLYFF